jgi:ribonuclease-3
MPASSRPSARRSTTSSRTRAELDSAGPDSERGAVELGRLISELPRDRQEHVFTHTSWVEDRAESYERLEFLGDSVLELAIARAVFDRFPGASEGRLAKVRAHVVSRQSCAAVAKQLGLGERLLEHAGDSPQDELQRISRSRNVLAAVLEAAIAAVYLEHGFEAIEPAIVGAFSERIEYARSSHVDYKTELQEALARTGRQVHYTVLEVEGPPHDRRFVCAAFVGGEQLGIGRGSTKKAAEQEAARQALDALGVVPDRI